MRQLRNFAHQLWPAAVENVAAQSLAPVNARRGAPVSDLSV
jgi:hypothetical protein